MQRLEECDESRRFRGRQVLPIRRHIAVALDDLSDELILGEPHRHLIERRPTLPPALTERVTVATLLRLKNRRATPFECGAADQIRARYGSATPRIHDRAPWRIGSQSGERTERHRDDQYHEHGDGPPSPAL